MHAIEGTLNTSQRVSLRLPALKRNTWALFLVILVNSHERNILEMWPLLLKVYLGFEKIVIWTIPFWKGFLVYFFVLNNGWANKLPATPLTFLKRWRQKLSEVNKAWSSVLGNPICVLSMHSRQTQMPQPVLVISVYRPKAASAAWSLRRQSVQGGVLVILSGLGFAEEYPVLSWSLILLLVAAPVYNR